MIRLFAPHALVSLLPVLLLGAALAYSYRAQAQDRGLAAARAVMYALGAWLPT